MRSEAEPSKRRSRQAHSSACQGDHGTLEPFIHQPDLLRSSTESVALSTFDGHHGEAHRANAEKGGDEEGVDPLGSLLVVELERFLELSPLLLEGG
jgi:hypothetical protein